MMKVLEWIAGILTSIVSIGKYLISRRKILWDKFVQWREGKREETVDKAIASRDSKRMGRILRKVLNKRDKRHKAS